jgi:hypothetical protein
MCSVGGLKLRLIFLYSRQQHIPVNIDFVIELLLAEGFWSHIPGRKVGGGQRIYIYWKIHPRARGPVISPLKVEWKKTFALDLPPPPGCWEGRKKQLPNPSLQSHTSVPRSPSSTPLLSGPA